MMSSTVRAAELLKTHRESIDRLDAILLNTHLVFRGLERRNKVFLSLGLKCNC